MLSLILLLCANILAVFAATSGCVPSTVGANGFVAKFYEYPLISDLGFKDNFFATNYRTKLLKTVNGITKINFQVDPQDTYHAIYGSIYGYRTTVTNYTVELGAFFLAPLSGKYTFYVGADNGVSLQLGSGQSCCNDATGSVTGNFSVEANGAGVGDLVVNKYSASFDLVAGVYYPIKIVHFNYRNGGYLNVAYTNPAGEKVTEIGSQVFQASFAQGQCTATVTSTWARSYTSTLTQSGVLTDTVIVEVPSPATTFTTVWTGSFTTTSTASGVQTNTVIVQVPKSTQTATTTWDHLYSSLSTISGALTNTVIVEVPTPTQTITTVWTGSYTTSSTEIGGVGSNNTVIVNIPKSTSTLTATWSNSFISTTTGTEVLVNTVYVEIPTPTQTITTVWTGSYTTSSTVIGGAGSNNTVIVNIPKVTTSTTKTWSNSFTSTSTVSGALTDTVHVDVPTIVPLSVASLSCLNNVLLTGWNLSFVNSDPLPSTSVLVSTATSASTLLEVSNDLPTVSAILVSVSSFGDHTVSSAIIAAEKDHSQINDTFVDYMSAAVFYEEISTTVPDATGPSQPQAASFSVTPSLSVTSSYLVSLSLRPQNFASVTSVTIYEDGASRISLLIMVIFVPLLALV